MCLCTTLHVAECLHGGNEFHRKHVSVLSPSALKDEAVVVVVGWEVQQHTWKRIWKKQQTHTDTDTHTHSNTARNSELRAAATPEQDVLGRQAHCDPSAASQMQVVMIFTSCHVRVTTHRHSWTEDDPSSVFKHNYCLYCHSAPPAPALLAWDY